ncbi:MAG: hypothetical protein LBH60_07650 [Prevotellaceae bacterium]|nr:hypothetical protein [Prevotellaceae bacterium]
MKVFSKLLMLALISSVFATGCKKDNDPPKDENLPLADVAGTYEGTITIPAVDTTTVSITIGSLVGDSVLLSLPAGAIKLLQDVPVSVNCYVTSDKDKYVIKGSKTLSLQGMPPIPVTVKETSNIGKAGNALLYIDVVLPEEAPPGGTLPITFEGEKKK